MSVNKFEPHLLVLPEDDADRQLVNGFITSQNLNIRAIQVLPVAGGWEIAVRNFLNEEVQKLRTYNQRRFLLLIDFDGDSERRNEVSNQIPEDISERVFVLGVLTEPERLRVMLGMNYEKIGASLADECYRNERNLWAHKLLAHNAAELIRLNESVRSFLFNA
jgi:hypothetical protein